MSCVRCFVAADFPEEVREDLAKLQKTLREQGLDLRWVRPGSMHLTIQFLGELPAETFEAVAAALAAPLGIGGALRIEPRGLGAFPSLRRARVLWVGLAGDVAGLARAAQAVAGRVSPLGVALEQRAFSPHLTLGRAPGGGRPPLSDAEKAVRAVGEYAGPAFDVTRFMLYESRLRPQGPLYIPRQPVLLA